MYLTKLFETQRLLDAEIERKHPTAPEEDRLQDKILALQVELAECANEWRGFKFWSTDREPRTLEVISSKRIPHLVNEGTEYEKLKFEYIPDKTKNPLLEEYVDCLHFIISIGIDVGIDDFNFSGKSPMPRKIAYKFSMVYRSISNFENMYYMKGKESVGFQFCVLLNDFIGLGEMLGFTWEQVTDAYMVKNAINHQRQETGY